MIVGDGPAGLEWLLEVWESRWPEKHRFANG
jgi:hypothetical protein